MRDLRTRSGSGRVRGARFAGLLIMVHVVVTGGEAQSTDEGPFCARGVSRYSVPSWRAVRFR
ncbi:hypothetical protein BAUCODRAFT_550347 [Baudoinia panamericana UAMH 10762]|uniref:Uncharacterized protein n=1 Tax=Baudoinia panamericana (strain UAMH 10762) TaxID=717646 RepID=M2N671_BAUPA|nr:uncharacterized protein BAUCODRAFT_550347 [Baudoinia panamericana UAMH 10762]EMC94519.1 hypothetical protein BAUCODRAFT_550347 [Baudoinia panamericana UAMH 10762]